MTEQKKWPPDPGDWARLHVPELDDAGQLTIEQRLEIVGQAILLLKQSYAHREHKLAFHGVDPVLRLEAVRRRLETLSRESSMDLTLRGRFHIGIRPYAPEIEFHREMSSIFASLRDRHTLYFLPRPFKRMVAFLPFEVERAIVEGEVRYLVTRVYEGIFRPAGEWLPDEAWQEIFFQPRDVAHPPLVPGWQLELWNGRPIQRAIEKNADEHAGSNPAARFVRGLERLTVRPLATSPAPEEVRVSARFITRQERYRDLVPDAEAAPEERVPRCVELDFAWLVTTLPRGGENFELEELLGLDEEVDQVHQYRLQGHERGWRGAAADDSGAPAAGTPAAGLEISETFTRYLSARPVRTEHGEFGYLRIHSFNIAPRSPVDFLDEVERLLTHPDMPQNGLIIDVRGNGGGVIPAGESILQLLTPRPIEPELFQFIVSPLTRKLTRFARGERRLPDLSAWRNSIDLAATIGMPYSRGAPLSDPELCNCKGQVYHGPLVLIVDGNCYSTTDIFVAGFSDHRIGPVLGIDENTGAGGANVWSHRFIGKVMRGSGADRLFPTLGGGTDLKVAIRRSLRVGRNAGIPLEDLGVVPDYLYSLTEDDLLYQNRDLVDQAAELLVRHEIEIEPWGESPEEDPESEPDDSGKSTGTRSGVVKLHRGEPDWPRPVARELMVRVTSAGPEELEVEVDTRGVDRVDVYVAGRPEATLDVERRLEQTGEGVVSQQEMEALFAAEPTAAEPVEPAAAAPGGRGTTRLKVPRRCPEGAAALELRGYERIEDASEAAGRWRLVAARRTTVGQE